MDAHLQVYMSQWCWFHHLQRLPRQRHSMMVNHPVNQAACTMPPLPPQCYRPVHHGAGVGQLGGRVSAAHAAVSSLQLLRACPLAQPRCWRMSSRQWRACCRGRRGCRAWVVALQSLLRRTTLASAATWSWQTQTRRMCCRCQTSQLRFLHSWRAYNRLHSRHMLEPGA